jgi:hypothetical protein
MKIGLRRNGIGIIGTMSENTLNIVNYVFVSFIEIYGE